MKKISFFSIVLISAVLFCLPTFVFGADFNEGFFIESQRFSSSDPAWAANVGLKFGIMEYNDFTLAFNGRIETVSENSQPFNGGAGLTDINYRLEPRIYFKNYYLSFNHWSLHKADVLGNVPNLNVITLAAEKAFGRLSVVSGIQQKMPNSDAEYGKVLFADATYFLRENGKGAYAREIVEVFPGIISKTEVGYRFSAKSGKLTKNMDVFIGYQYGGKEKIISSQYGLAAEGFFGGFRLNF